MNVYKMSIEEKVGQLFMVGFHDTKPTGEVIQLITGYKVGGLCYFNRNIRNPRQLHTLSKNLQSYAHIDLPLFLAIFQEGGHLNNFTNGVTQGPGQATLGDVNNRLYTKQMAEIVAEELRAVGINMNFAPALHTKENEQDESSFSNSIDLVAKHGVASIQGNQKADVSAVAKYFPGKVDIKMERLLTEAYDNPSSALYPFYQAVQKNVDAMLVSQEIIPNASTEDPSLFSHSILHVLLREQLQYEGIIITEFHGDNDPELLAKSAIVAIQSGVDLLFIREPYKTQIYAIDIVIEAVKKGVIPEDRLNEAVERILTLKKKRNIGKLKPFDREKFEKKRAVAFVNKLEKEAASHT